MEKILTRRGFLAASAATAAALGAMTLAGCGSNQVESSGTDDDEEDDATEEASVKISEMTDEELQEAWEQEEAYGETLTVLYPGGLCLSGFAIAKAQGYYEAEGLDIELITGSFATDVVGTGSAVMSGSHICSLLVPAANGVGLTLVTPIQTGCQSLYVLADSEYETTSDLVGGTIACPMGIGVDSNIAMRYLQRDGIDVNSVSYKQVDQDAVIVALQNGEVQAATLSDQFAYDFMQEGIIRYIRSLTYDEDFAVEPCCVVCVNTEFMETNPVTTYKLVRAVSEAQHWIGNNVAEAAEVLVENSWSTSDLEMTEHWLSEWNFLITDEECETALNEIIEDYLSFEVFDDNGEDVATILDRVWYPVLEN